MSVAALPAAARSVPDYDFQWVTIGNLNNPAYSGPSNPNLAPFPNGRGSVGYEYRISKLEITTAQWLEFVNTFATQSRELANEIGRPTQWGARTDNGYSGPGDRYVLGSNPNARNYPVAGISWRVAAMYCNWLHNDKSSSPSAIRSGAYDASTWGNGITPGTVTDAPTRMPGAKFFIPSFDEWTKAAHYDPTKGGVPGVGGGVGYWLHTNRTDDAPPVPGIWPDGETIAGTSVWNIPLGCYPQTTSYYGLLDLSGGASEWVEDYDPQFVFRARGFRGSANDINDINAIDRVFSIGASGPSSGPPQVGLRVASIPTPSASVVLGLACTLILRRKR
ncbi:MAG: SUMF1/EgtB/PvdO family nonheme iron enzyme [Phycisphaerales bacterium]|nr:SUMF1/EgtB/PvdO family nonheme iron enzyme [Phycisphaerales bacterium]